MKIALKSDWYIEKRESKKKVVEKVKVKGLKWIFFLVNDDDDDDDERTRRKIVMDFDGLSRV
jgi:hypothetical protein